MNTVVTKSDEASSEMRRLSRILSDTDHAIAVSLRLQLEDLRAKLKKVRHVAMQAMSKLVVPDDLRTYIVDYSAVLPEHMTSRQTTCHVTRDPLERGIGSDEPPLLAAHVKNFSEECIKASALMREVISMVTVASERSV